MQETRVPMTCGIDQHKLSRPYYKYIEVPYHVSHSLLCSSDTWTRSSVFGADNPRCVSTQRHIEDGYVCRRSVRTWTRFMDAPLSRGLSQEDKDRHHDDLHPGRVSVEVPSADDQSATEQR